MAAAVLLNFSSTLNAQVVTGTATVRGVVSDPTGAVVPGATITIEATQRKFKVDTNADGAGRYLFPTLLPGEYKLSVSAAGFKGVELSPFSLQASQGSTLNLELTVGNTSDRIEVTEAPPLLQTANANLGSVIDSSMILNLPLINRNWTALQLTLPGTTNNYDIYGATWNNVNGVAEQPAMFGQNMKNNNYTMDGATNNGSLMNTIVMFPPPETIDQVDVQIGQTTSAAGGWSSGAAINVVTKGGTNKIHGDIWEAFRHDKLDAKEYYDSEVGVYRFSQFGGAVGGPVIIPKLISKEKGFYFYAWAEGVRFRRAFAIQGIVPDPKVFQGDFSDLRSYPDNVVVPIFDPLTTQIVGPSAGASSRFTRQQFPGNRIPPSRIDPGAQLWFTTANIPAPNRPRDLAKGTNYINNSPNRSTTNNFSGRLDRQWGKHNTLGRFTRQDPHRFFTYLYPDEAQTQIAKSSQITISDIWTVTPTLFITNRLGRIKSGMLIGWPTLEHDDTLAEKMGTLTAFPAYYDCKMWPSIGLGNNYFNAPRHGQPPNCQTINGGFGPEATTSWNTDVQKIKGPHTLAFGFNYAHVFSQEGSAGNAGVANFSDMQTSNDGPRTGNGAASFLLGIPDRVSRQFGQLPATGRSFGMGFYAQDNWRVNKKLTLNLGLRWDFAQRAVGDRTGKWVWDEPGTAPFDGKITIRDNVKGYPIYYLIDSYNPITKEEGNAPHGVYPARRGNFSPRFGFAYQFAPKTVFRAGFALFYNLYGLTSEHRTGNNGWPWTQSQDVPVLNRPFPTTSWLNPFPALAPLGSYPILPTQIPDSWEKIRIKSRPGYTESWDAAIQRQIMSSVVLELAYYGSHSINNYNPVVANAAVRPGTDPVVNRRPFPQFDYNWGTQQGFPSWYNGGILKLEKRWSNNLTLLTHLTWSKMIGYAGYYGGQPTDYDQDFFRAVNAIDNPLRFVMSGVYALPGKTQYRALNWLVAGWTMAGVVQKDSGHPTSVFLGGFDQSNTGGELNRPDRVGNPILEHPDPNYWFNKAAFRYPAFGTRGNIGFNQLRGDDGFQVDFGIHKKFNLPKEGAWLEFKTDAYNLSNTPTFGSPRENFDGTFPAVPNVMRGKTPQSRKITLELKIHF